eukprot:XP_017947137.1 PREDICTED: protein nepro homolog isoform X2 [Xenopus tropicalis]
MASEPWNRLHIPRPAIQSLVTVPASAETEEYIKAVVEKCLSVKQSLMSKVLETEKSALYSILYVYHHQLGYHKPYLALKQVEQCLKRLAAMGLEVTIQEMLDLCPRYFGVLHRGILKKLISLYGAQYLLQKEVSDFQNMPYIKNFTFPTKIEDFLGPVYASINKRKLPHISFKKGALQILHTVFSSHDLDDNEEERHKSAFEELTDTVETVVDIGLPVQAKRSYRDNCGTFDVKTLCQKQQSSFNHPCNVKKKSMASKNKRIIQCYRKSNSECAGHLVPKLQETETFRELAEKLQYALKWCKRRKLLPEVLFFRKKCLRANRLKHVELLGYSLQKKLRCFKKSVCQSLCQGNLRRNHHMPSLRIPRLKWTVKHKVTCRRKRKRLNALNHPIIYSESGVERTHHKNASICLDLNLGAQEVSTATTDVLLASGHITANDKSESLSVPLCLETKIITDDIDDIFSSIGV